MIFRRAEPTGHYDAMRLVSAEGIWEFGLSLRPTGTRLRMGRRGRPPSVLDFCMGTDATIYAEIFQAVLRRLELLPETALAAEIDAAFPWAGTRPDLTVHLQPLCAGAGEKTAGSPRGNRITRTASQIPSARVTSALSQRLVK